MKENEEVPAVTPAATPTSKPAWYSRKGLSIWVVIGVVLLILAAIPFTPKDHPSRLWIFLGAVAVAIALYFYTHPKDNANK